MPDKENLIAKTRTHQGKNDFVPWCLGGELLFTALVYSRSLGNEFVLDDRYEISANSQIENWSFVWNSMHHNIMWFLESPQLFQFPYYRPMHALWLALNYHLFGRNPAGWHAAIIFLHLLAVWLVFRVASLLTSDRLAALAAAGLFGLMPIHAEAVSWPAAAATPLSAVFELGAFDFYLRRCASAGSDRSRPFWLALSLGLFGGALLSYEAAVVFPALIAVHAFLLEPNRSYGTYKSYGTYGTAHRTIAAAWPYALEMLVYLLLRLRVLGFISNSAPLQRHLTPLQSALSIPGAVWTYVTLLAMPWRAGPAHRMAVASGLAASEFYLPVIGLAAASIAGFLLLRHHEHRRQYLFCTGWFLISFAPMLNFNGVSTTDPIHDRYLYFASVGFCVMLADIAAGLVRKTAIGIAAAAAGGAAVALAFGAMLYSVQGFWHDDVAAYSAIAGAFPRDPDWHRRLAAALQERGDLARARDQLEAAVRLAPRQAEPLRELAIVDAEMGDRRGAEQAIAERIKRIDRPAPSEYSRLAFAADAAGDSAGAEAALEQAEALPGGAETAAIARAQIRFLHGDRKGAESALRAILDRDPADPQALSVLGSILLDQRRYDDALKILRGAAALDPRNLSLRYKIAVALHGLGREREARKECAAVLAGAPADRKALALMDAIEQGGPE